MRNDAPVQEQAAAGRTTWQYLRVAIVLVVVGLFVAIAIEIVKAGCLQTSISAYYYTPVRGFFVGALMTIGVCLVALKGNTPLHDVLLNLAGGFAPVVALVPTKDPANCSSVVDEHVAPNIANNVPALLVVAGLGLVLARLLVNRSGDRLAERKPAPLGWLLAAAVWAGATGVFVADRDLFDRWAHLTAAVLMFACIFLVVVTDALDYASGQPAPAVRNRYGVIAGAMLASMLGAGAMWAAGSRHSVFAVEAALIVLFAVYWAIQTRQLWGGGDPPEGGSGQPGAGHPGGAQGVVGGLGVG